MRIDTHGDGSRTIGWTERDTHEWANRHNARWPCSVCSGRTIQVGLDAHGDLVELEAWDENGQRIDDFDPPADEINAMIADAQWSRVEA